MVPFLPYNTPLDSFGLLRVSDAELTRQFHYFLEGHVVTVLGNYSQKKSFRLVNFVQTLLFSFDSGTFRA